MEFSQRIKIVPPRVGIRGSLNLADREDMIRTARCLPEEEGHIYRGLVHMQGHWKTISRGCKRPEEWEFLMRLLLSRPGENNGIVERNLELNKRGGRQCRMTNPFTALKELREWESGTGARLKELLAGGWHAETFVVQGDIVDTGDRDWVTDTQAFFSAVKGGLTRLVRGGRAVAMWGHEVSVASLSSGTLQPHTHVVVFCPRGKSVRDVATQIFSERRVAWDGRVRTLDGLSRYLFAIHTPMEVYTNESSWEDLAVLNRAAWDWVENMRWVMSGVRRVGAMGLGRKKSSLPSSGGETRINEKYYAYEKHGRLYARSRGGAGRRNSSGALEEGGGLSPASRNRAHESEGSREGCSRGESGLSQGTKGGHARGGRRGGSSGRTVQGGRGDNDKLHEGLRKASHGEGGIHRGTPTSTQATSTGRCSPQPGIHGWWKVSSAGGGGINAISCSGPGTQCPTSDGRDAQRNTSNGCGKLAGG